MNQTVVPGCTFPLSARVCATWKHGSRDYSCMETIAYEHLIFCPEEQTMEEMVFSGVDDMIDVT